MKKIFSTLLFIILFAPFIVLADTIEVNTWEELSIAVSNVNDNDTIFIKKELEANSSIVIDKDIEINGNNYEIKSKTDYNGTIFEVSTDKNFKLVNINFDGGNEWSWINQDDRLDPYKNSKSDLTIGESVMTQSVIISNGNLTIKNSMFKNYFLSDENTNIINILGTVDRDVVLDLENVSITHCYGAVLKSKYSDITIKDSIFTDNYGYGNKGGIFQLFRTDAVVNNSSIKDNLGLARSGSIFGVVDASVLTFNDVIMENNLAKYHGSASTGSMVTIESGGGFVFNSGVITNNIGTLASVVSSRWTNTSSSGDAGIFINGGIIKDNTTYVDTWNNATIFLRSSGTIAKGVNLEGTVVVNNTSASLLNNGTISELVVNNSTAKVVNNGVVKSKVIVTAGEVLNNGTMNNVYLTNVSMNNKGVIEGEYVKKMTPASNQVVVTLNADGGRIMDEGYTLLDILVEKGCNVDLSQYVTDVQKRGFTYEKEWCLDKECNNIFVQSNLINENIEIYPKCSRNKYKVIWNIDGVLVEEYFEYGSNIVIPDVPEKDGFEFIGWDEYYEDFIMSDSDVEFTATWKQVEEKNPNTSDKFIIAVLLILFSVILIKYKNKVKQKLIVYE